ncbi:hypothetical protein GCM10009434_05000 [Brevundimonas olei]
MRTALILIMVLALSACATKPVPVVPKPVEMPALPAALAQKAEPLPALRATDLNGHLLEGADSDRRYNEVRDRHNALIDLYECVRLALLDGTDALRCLS